MTNEIKNVPELRFPGFEVEWRLINLKNCFHTIKNGFVGTATPFYTDNSGVRYLQSNNVKNGFLNDNVKIYVTKEFNEKYKSNQLKSGDMLMVQSGHAGATAVVSDAYEGSNCHALIIMKPKSNINTVFLNNYFQSGKGVKSIYSLITGNTIKHILSSDVKKITFSTPVIGEQEKIGDFFSKLDRQIELEEQKLAKLEEQKKGYMQKIFSQQLRFKGENGNDYPEWKKEIIGNIAITFSGGTPSSTNSTFYTGEIPFIRSGEISKTSTELMINEKAISNSSAKMVETGDLLYALYGATSGEVAISKINGAINQAVLCIRSQESIAYIFNYLKMKKDQILKTYIQGGQGNLSASIIKKVDIDLPNLEEQKLIGHFFNKFDDYIEIQSDKVELLKERKKGFLQKMFV